MRPTRLTPQLQRLLRRHPSIGCLIDLCEENYAALRRLIPELPRMRGNHASHVAEGTDLHLEILEQTPYTTLVHLTYFFDQCIDPLPDPDLRLRVYHDSQQVEVVDLRQSALPLPRAYAAPALLQKWRVGLFLSKWLNYCLSEGHRFGPRRTAPEAEPDAAELI